MTFNPEKFITAALAGFFGWWGFRGAVGGSPIGPDASRHMMNGAMLYDMFRTGHAFHPVQFAQSWYARLPAISLPYHPPLFPLIESLFYSVAGVSYWVARLAVACAVALSVFLLARLVTATHRSYGLALAALLVLFSSARSQTLASEVMLEFPAMVFTLLALGLLCDLAFRDELTWRRGLSFGLAGAAAVCTRQNALFLVAVPWLLVLLNGSWRVLRRGAIWVSSAAIAASFGVLEFIQFRYQIGFNQAWKDQALPDRIARNAGRYLKFFIADWGWISSLLALAIGSYFYLRRRRDPCVRAANLYIAWLIAGLGLHLLIPPNDARYAFLWEPALIVFTLAMLGRMLRSEPLVAALAVIFFAFHVNRMPSYFYGPAEAARVVIGPEPGRVVTMGANNGAIVAAIRAADPDLRTTVIRGDKLPVSLLNEDFFHRFGIRHVVMVHGDIPEPWEALWNNPPPGLRLRDEIAVRSSEPAEGHLIRVYDFTNPSENPERILDERSGFAATGLHLVLP